MTEKEYYNQLSTLRHKWSRLYDHKGSYQRLRRVEKEINNLNINYGALR